MLNFYKKIPISTYRAGLLQAQAYRALSHFMTQALAKHDLSMPQWTLLGILRDQKTCRPSSLATLLGVKPPVATRLLGDLIKKGLATKTPHSTDNRGAIAAITPAGATLVAHIERTLRLELRKFLADLSIGELRTYLKVLSKLASKL